MSPKCRLNFKSGWSCRRSPHIDGPCALEPRWWNLKGLWIYYLKG